MKKLCVLLAFFASFAYGEEIRIGSKAFTESIILGEIALQAAKSLGYSAKHKAQLGGTGVVWSALLNGEIDVYAEYSGTLMRETLARENLRTLSELRNYLHRLGLQMSDPLGFNNTYALAMKADRARELGIQKISDLQKFPSLRFGFSEEFMERSDGWPALKARYSLPQTQVKGLQHDLAYQALKQNQIDVTDAYTTDAKILLYNLTILQDDRNHFPEYLALWVYRKDLARKAPDFIQTLNSLAGKISEDVIRKLNARVDIDKITEAQAAEEFWNATTSQPSPSPQRHRLQELLKNARDHLDLVWKSLALAILVALPLGILSAKKPLVGQIILGIAGIIQTIPSIALLMFMIPFLGLEARPAIAALFLYSLLPIIRNTYTGLTDIPPHIRESAEALGLPPFARLRLVEIPLALRTILAGIKTSAVINVGTATLGAFIGAGGFGQPIFTGIRRYDVPLILEGAIPAAVLALLAQLFFEILERIVVPRGLRYQP
jgi:osmoprotectant transport system permease protein